MLSSVAQAHHHTERLGAQPGLAVKGDAVDVAVLDEQGGLYMQNAYVSIYNHCTSTFERETRGDVLSSCNVHASLQAPSCYPAEKSPTSTYATQPPEVRTLKMNRNAFLSGYSRPCSVLSAHATQLVPSRPLYIKVQGRASEEAEREQEI